MANTINYHQILSTLRQKRGQIEEAIVAIERLAQGESKAPTKTGASKASKHPGSSTHAAKKHRISPEGRKRIAEAARRRWAAKRAAEAAGKAGQKKTAAKKTA